MIYRDPKCVFVADSLGLAEVVVVWLGDHDIQAQVMNSATLGGLDGLTWLSKTGIAASGIEVWVLDLAQAASARALVEEHVARMAARTSGRDAGAAIEVTCDDCGAANEFPGTEAGKVVNCSRCGAHLDVPDPASEDEMNFDEGDPSEDV